MRWHNTQTSQPSISLLFKKKLTGVSGLTEQFRILIVVVVTWIYAVLKWNSHKKMNFTLSKFFKKWIKENNSFEGFESLLSSKIFRNDLLITIVSWKIFIYLCNKFSLSSMLGDRRRDTCKDDPNSSLLSRNLSWRGLLHGKVQSDYYLEDKEAVSQERGPQGPHGTSFWMKARVAGGREQQDHSRLAMSCYKNGAVCNFQLNANNLLMIEL